MDGVIMFWRKRIRELESRIEQLEYRNFELYKKQFREGDKVYIDNEYHSNQKPVYLKKSYNGGECYYFTKHEDDTVIERMNYAIHINKCSFEKPKVCDCCNQIIK